MKSAPAGTVVLWFGLVIAGIATSGYVAAGCVFRSALDCELTLGYDCGGAASTSTSSNGGTGGAAGSTSGSSSSTNSGGGGSGGTGSTTSVECTDVSMCGSVTVPPGPCASLGKKACVGGKCVVQYTAADAPSQQYGSCKVKKCNDEGELTEEADDSNVYDDGNTCTEQKCNGGVASSMDLAPGTACTEGGADGFCTANPDPYNASLMVCSKCNPGGPNTCIGGATCVKGVCVPLHCTNGVKDSGEADIDCGGSTSGCLKCPAMKTCTNGMADCWSGLCISNKCTPAMCADGIRNADETDADCGGLLCGNLCADGLACIVAGDCQSHVCMNNACQPASCTDGVQNGDEDGLDCGGMMSQCPPCAM